MRLLLAGLLLVPFAFAERKQGTPLDHLPGDTEILTHFGERADFSPDNQRIAFNALRGLKAETQSVDIDQGPQAVEEPTKAG